MAIYVDLDVSFDNTVDWKGIWEKTEQIGKANNVNAWKPVTNKGTSCWNINGPCYTIVQKLYTFTHKFKISRTSPVATIARTENLST